MLKKYLIKIKNIFFPSKKHISHKKWVNVDGDNTLRLNYDLTADSNVFDLGGYKGDWSYEINRRYNCNIYIFEPYIVFAKIIKERFQNEDKIKIYEFGLAEADCIKDLFIADNSSSILNISNEVTKIKLIDAKKFLSANDIGTIDLMKINIEGAEYNLLDYLIEIELTNSIKNIQIQFHDFVPDATHRAEKIRSLLSTTHELTYYYPWIWENWKIKS